MEDVADFKPNAQEEDAIIGPFESRQEVQMATWLLEELRLQEWFVETKAQTTEQVEAGLVDMDAHEKPSDIQATDLCGDYSHGYLSATKPCEAVKQQSNWIRLCGAGQLDLYQCPPLHISPELMSTMHSAVNAFRGATGTLRDHLAAADAGMTAGIKQGAIAWGALGWYGDMSDYTHAWIQMNLQECRNSNYENAAYRTQGDLTAAEESEFFVAEIQCWATRYEVPPGSKTEGRVVEPLWWQEYLRDQKSTIFPRD